MRGPQLQVIDPRPESLPERLVREVADGGVVAIPDGTYRDVYLSTSAGGAEKAMTIRSESGQPGGVVLTGASHVRVRSGDVAVQGIVFKDTTCHDKLEDADRAGGYLPGHVVNVDANASRAGNITVSNNVFDGTCHGGILSGGLDGAGSGNASDVAISNNTFRDIGYNARHYDGVPDRLRHAITTGAYGGSVQTLDAEISSNAFERVAGIAVDVRQARNLDVSGNTFADVPLSAVRVHGGSDGVAVRGNTITNASYAPNYDFLRGVEGSANLTQDAAILVIPDDGGLLGRTVGVNVTGNDISQSGGAFSVCGAVCEGNASAGYASASGSDADSIVGPADQDIRFNWNTVHMDNGGRLVENGVRGALDARYNYYPGYEPAAGLFRAGAQESGQLPAGTVLYRPLFTLAPDDPTAPSVLRVTSANASGSYDAGDRIDIAVEFTKPVAMSAGAAPVLTIDAGPVDRGLGMTRHDASVLTFRYEVADGDSSPALEYASRSSLAAGGGSMADMNTGAPANLTLPARGSPESLSSRGLVIGTPDTAAPTVLSVTSGSADGTYGPGRLVEVRVAFSENVLVDTGAGTPAILLDTGGAGSTAEYARGSGTGTLVFEYYAAPGDASADLDYAGTNALRPNGATITDRVRNAANLTLPEPGGPGSLGRSKDIRIDGVSPTVLSVSSPDSSGPHMRGDTIRIEAMFSEDVSVVEAGGATQPPTIALDTGAAGGARTAEYDASASAGRTLAFTYTVREGDYNAVLDYASATALAANGAAIKDAAGNDANLTLPRPGSPDSLGGSKGIAIDGVSPTVLSVSSSDNDGTYRIDMAINITVAFSEDVDVMGEPALALETGTTDRTAAYDPAGSAPRALAFVYTVRPGDETGDLEYAGTGALTAAGAAIKDAAGNDANLTLPRPGSPDSLGGSKDIAIDTTVLPDNPAHVLLVASPDAGGAHGAGSAVNITVAFSRAVHVEGSPVLALSTVPPRSAEYVQGTDGGSELAFLYAVQPGDSADPLNYPSRAALDSNGAAVLDDDGNNASLALPAPDSPQSLRASGITVDGVAPAVVNVTSPDADGTYGVGSRINITVSFDEPVMVAGSPRIFLDAGAAVRTAAYDPASSTDRTLAFVYTVRPGDETGDLEYAGTGALTAAGAAIKDAAGNGANLTLPRPGSPDSLGGSKDIAIDTTVLPDNPAHVLLVASPDAGGAHGAGSAVNITVAFSRAVHVEGSPVLALSTVPPRSAEYVQGTDGGSELAFLYAVQPGDSADPLDYASGSALYLAGGTIKDADGNNAVLALPAPGSPQSLRASGIVIGTGGPGPGGTDPPAPVAVTVQARGGGGGAGGGAPGPYSAGQTIVIGIEFSAPVTVRASAAGATPYLELRTGSAGALAAYASGSGTRTLEFEYAVRGGDLTGRLSYADASALILNGSEIAAAGTGEAASVVLPEPGAPGSLSDPGGPAVRIDPEPGRPILQVGILDDAGPGGSVSMSALAAAAAFNERQGLAAAALIVNATSYNAGNTAESAAGALRAAHAGGSGPSVYVGPSTDRGLHAAMPYAAANNIVLVSAGSTAPSLAVEDDLVFRLLPSARLDAEALARHALNAGSESLHAVLENATHGPPTAAGQALEDATPPAQGRFSHAFDAALAYAGVPSLSGTVTLAGTAGSYGAAEAAEALDASVRSASARAAVVYMGSPEGLAALAAASGQYPALASAVWLATGLSAGSVLLAGDGPAAAFAAEAGLSAARWSPSAGSPAREIDPLLPPEADAGALHRAYAAYDAVLVIGEAAAGARGGDGTTDAAEIAGRIPAAAAAYSGALGDIALDHAGDLWVPAAYDLWTVAQAGAGGAGGSEWSRQQDALDEERACSIALARAKIDYGPIDSGQTSRPHLQTIVNTGQLPFSRVDLTATPWHVDSPGACEPGDTPSLPVGLSEIRTELGGDFTDLAGSGTVLARGLEAGGLSPLWYRLSLAGYADLPQAQITQCATYVVRCG